MPGSSGSAEAEEGGASSDDDSGVKCRELLSDPRWSRVTGGTKGWRLRGVEWRVKLGILPGGNAAVDAMRRATADGRRKYADLRRRLLVDPHVMDDEQTPHPMMDNPLSLDPQSVWGRYFRNAELEKTIEKDLTRLYPEHGVFFQSAPCQAMMRRILLVWSLLHPQFSYRQGMHELLAPLLYVLHVDVVRLSQVKHRFEDLFDDRFDSLSIHEQHVRDKVESAKNFCGEMIVAGDSINFGGDPKATNCSAVDPEEQRVDLSVIIHGSDMYGVEGELGALLSARFLEHDAYCMLDTLLSGQDGAVAMADYFMSSGNGGKPLVIEASDALYRTLAAADVTLYTHLVELGVEPQFFALRWLRLLFGREFVLEDLLQVWDAIFGADNTPEDQHGGDSEMKISQRGALISSFSVSMLLYVRLALLAAPDVTSCLQRLLHFPQVPDVRDLIESAKSLQLLALTAVKSPTTPVPRYTRTSEIRGTGKHVRNGSISPPTPQRHVTRPPNSTSSQPEVLRVSMSLPGSYWEEKWTHSVLQMNNPEELSSPSRTESVARGVDNVNREDSITAGMLIGTTSDGRHQYPDPCAANLGIKVNDSSHELSDDGGQEMSRRGGPASTEDAVPSNSSLNSTFSKIESDSAPGPSGSKELEDQSTPGPGEDVPLACAPALEQACSSDLETRDNSAVLSERQGSTSSQMGSANVGDGRVALEADQVSECGNEMDSMLQDSGPVQAGLDTCQIPLESGKSEAVSTITALTGSLTEITKMSPSRVVAMDKNVVCAPGSRALNDMSISQKPVLEQSNAPQSESARDLQPVLDDPSANVSSESLETKPRSEDESKGVDTHVSVTSSKSSAMEDRGIEGLEEGTSTSVEASLLPTKSKAPPPPSRVGRFNWMWNLGRSSIGEKAVSNKVSKEDMTANDSVANLSGIATDSEVSSSSSTAANTPQRRKKSWWRANSDVVPEGYGETSSIDVSNAVDPTCDAHGPIDLAKSIIEPAVMALEGQLKEDLMAEIPVTSQDSVKKPKDMTPSAALQALGQSVLEHVQVLESALAQKVTGLGVENKMWNPAIREKNESTNRAGLGSMGQGAALSAIAELRRISQALQQM